ncbi:MAG: hypothetical protein U1E58_02205 [Tabrizicola sp.]
MTLWERTSEGIWLCVVGAVPGGIAWWLTASGSPDLQVIGTWFGATVGGFGLIFFGIGALIVLGGVYAYLRDAWRRRLDA